MVLFDVIVQKYNKSIAFILVYLNRVADPDLVAMIEMHNIYSI